MSYALMGNMMSSSLLSLDGVKSFREGERVTGTGHIAPSQERRKAAGSGMGRTLFPSRILRAHSD